MENKEEMCKLLVVNDGAKETPLNLEIERGKPDNITILSDYIESTAESKEEIELLLQLLEICLCGVD